LKAKNKNLKSLDQFIDEKIGEKGTEKREEFETEYVPFKLGVLKPSENIDWADEISNQEKESIELGISDADNGRLKPNSEAKKIYGKWL